MTFSERNGTKSATILTESERRISNDDALLAKEKSFYERYKLLILVGSFLVLLVGIGFVLHYFDILPLFLKSRLTNVAINYLPLSNQNLAQSAPEFGSNVFYIEPFKKCIPYFNKLMVHYPENIEIFMPKCMVSEGNFLDKFLEPTVMTFKQNPSDGNFGHLSELFQIVLKFEKTDFIQEIFKLKVSPLSLAIFALAPLPPKYFCDFQFLVANSEKYQNDNLLAYLSSLKTTSVSGPLYNMDAWFTKFDVPDMENMANILNYGKLTTSDNNNAIYYRLAAHVSALKIDAADINLVRDNRDLVLMSTLPTDPVQEIVNKSPVSNSALVINMENSTPTKFKASDYIKADQITASTDYILFNLIPNPNEKGTTFESSLTFDTSDFVLEAVVIQNKNSANSDVVIFDKTVKMWTLFKNQKIITIPTWLALQLASNFGTACLYTKV